MTATSTPVANSYNNNVICNVITIRFHWQAFSSLSVTPCCICDYLISSAMLRTDRLWAPTLSVKALSKPEISFAPRLLPNNARCGCTKKLHKLTCKAFDATLSNCSIQLHGEFYCIHTKNSASRTKHDENITPTTPTGNSRHSVCKSTLRPEILMGPKSAI